MRVGMGVPGAAVTQSSMRSTSGAAMSSDRLVASTWNGLTACTLPKACRLLVPSASVTRAMTVMSSRSSLAPMAMVWLACSLLVRAMTPWHQRRWMPASFREPGWLASASMMSGGLRNSLSAKRVARSPSISTTTTRWPSWSRAWVSASALRPAPQITKKGPDSRLTCQRNTLRATVRRKVRSVVMANTEPTA